MIPLFDIAFAAYGSVALTGFFGCLYRSKRSNIKAENVEFVIPSVANEKTLSSLRNTVFEVQKRFPNYKIWVVVDEHKILINGCQIVVVPKEFKGRKCKGRALEYFTRNYVKDDKWYVFLDDDSYPLDDSFLYEIPYYEAKGYVASNGKIIPRTEKSKICNILDYLRLWDDIFIFKFATGLLGKPVIGLHGELLILKGKVLREIGFSVSSLTEDFHLAQQLIKKGYKTWQSKTIVSIKPPNNLKDFWRQRARWIKGVLLDLRNAYVFSVPFIVFRLIGGIAASLLFFPLWFIFPATTPIALLGFFGTLYFLSSYVYGIMKLKVWKYLLLLPVFGIFEPLSLFFIPKTNGFTVIDKN